MNTAKLASVVYRSFIALVLAYIAFQLAMIRKNMPPSMADIKNGTPEERKALYLKRPLVEVSGNVDVENIVEVQIKDIEPVNVRVENTPDVRVVR